MFGDIVTLCLFSLPITSSGLECTMGREITHVDTTLHINSH